MRLLDLESCNRYWVVISGHYCTLTGSTTPALVDYYSSAQYELTVTLGGKDEVCNTWVTENPEEKAMDMEVGLQKPASDCGFSIPCYEGSRWECTEGDPTKVTFKYVKKNNETDKHKRQCTVGHS